MDEEDIRQAVKDEATKKIIKDAIHEWLDEQFAKFGKWSFYGIVASGTAVVLYMVLITNGWHKP